MKEQQPTFKAGFLLSNTFGLAVWLSPPRATGLAFSCMLLKMDNLFSARFSVRLMLAIFFKNKDGEIWRIATRTPANMVDI